MRSLHILLFGNDQVGKTSFGNSILGYRGLDIDNFNQQTGDPVCNSSTREDRNNFIHVIDTPGFSRSRQRVINVIIQKKNEITHVAGTLFIMFVVRADHLSDNDCWESIQAFNEVFGDQFSDKTIVVVTHCNSMGRNFNLLTSCGPQLRTFIRNRNLRHYIFDILRPDIDIFDILRPDIPQLISLIESETNTNSMYFLGTVTIAIAFIALRVLYTVRH